MPEYIHKKTFLKLYIYFQLNNFYLIPNQFCWGVGVSNYNKENAAALERTWRGQMADYKETLMGPHYDNVH